MSKTRSFAQKAFKVALAFILALGLSPTLNLTAFADTEEDAIESAAMATSIDEQVDELLAAGNYVEGQALVVVADGEASANLADEATSESEQLLTGARTLMQVDGQALADAAGQDDAAESQGDAALAAAEEDGCSIVLVESDTLTTRELLEVLLANDRVVSAEPNYIYTVEADELDVEASVVDETAEAVADEATEAVADETAAAATTTEAVAADAATADVAAVDETTDVSTNANEAVDADTDATADLQEGGTLITGGGGTPIDASAYQWGFSNDTSNGYLTSASDEPQRMDGFDLGLEGWNQYDNDTGKPVANAVGVVAIMDTGIDFENRDLKNVMITNAQDYLVGTPYENSGASLSNGYDAATATDDAADHTIMDPNGHGTHVAGIVGAEWNDIGTSGAASGIKLLGIRAADVSTSSFLSSYVVDGYEYLSCAVQNGLQLVAVNNSWTCSVYVSTAVSVAVAKLGNQGVTSIFGSGNDAANTDRHASTPFSLANNPYVVSVNAANYVGGTSAFTNWGINSTHVYSPGTGILSTKSQYASQGYTGITDENALVQEFFNGGIDSDAIKIAEVKDCTFASLTDISAQAAKADGSDLDDYLFSAEDTPASYSSDSTADADTGSLCLDSEKMSVVYSAGAEGNVDSGMRIATVYVKMSKNDAAQIKYQSALMRNAKSKVHTLLIAPMMRKIGDTSNDVKLYSPSTSYAGDVTWDNSGIGVSGTLLGSDEDTYELATVAIAGDENNVYVPFTVFAFSNSYKDTDDNFGLIYVDAMCAGTSDSSWTYESGTSMATPAVSGCAAIVAKQQGTLHFNDDEASACAIERADLLKSSIIALSEGSEDARPCSQSGMVNLKVQDTERTPVIHSATQNSDGTITVTGSYFGTTKGSVALDLTTVSAENISEWSNTSITFTLPDGLESSTYALQVIASNNKMSKRYVEIDAVGIQMFPTSRTAFDTLIADDVTGSATSVYGSLIASMCTLGNKIYCAPATSNMTVSSLLAYDIDSDTWSEIEGFPADTCYFPSIAAYQDKIFLYATVVDDSSDDSKTLLAAYDQNTQDWCTYDVSALDELKLGMGGTLVSTSDTLLVVGGATQDTMSTYIDDGIIKLTLTENEPDIPVQVESVGDLAFPGTNMKAAVRNGSIYVGNGNIGTMASSDDPLILCPYLQRLDYDEETGTWVATDISDSLPDFYLYGWTDPEGNAFGPSYGLAATSEGIVISGTQVNDSEGYRAVTDTFILRDGSDTFEPFTIDGTTYAASLDTLIYPISVSANGELFTIGMSVYAEYNSALIFRSVDLNETLIDYPTGKTLTYTAAMQDGVVEGDGFTVTNGSATDAGTYVATATLKSGYVWADGSYDVAKVEFTIEPASLEEGAVVGAIADQTWTGSAIEPAITVTYGDLVLIEGVDFEVSYANNVEVGTATVTVTGIGNFAGTLSATFDIVAAQPVENEYKIIEGAGQTIDVSKVSSATFRSDAPFAKFSKLVVDGADVDAKYYDVSEGSTVVTLNKAFLSTLANGEHSLSVVATDGHADTTFTITGQGSGNNTSAKTGDTALPLLPAGLALMGAVAAAYALRRSKEC